MIANSSMRFYTTLAVLAFVEFFASGFVLIFQPEAVIQPQKFQQLATLAATAENMR
jgi:hypothetical protein